MDAPLEIRISAEVAALLEERGIRTEDIRAVLEHGEATGNICVREGRGRLLTCLRPAGVTFWVEYGREDHVYRVYRAYTHRMEILEGFNLPAHSEESSPWSCLKCGVRLEPALIKLHYIDETFEARTFACPSCQRALISEEDAVGKMARAEKMLEDK